MNLFILRCQYLWFLYILHREICLMADNYNGIIVSRNKRQKKHCLDFFFLFKISNGIQKHGSRQLSDGNQFKIVISSIQSPGRIKRSFVLCYKPLPSSCASDRSRRQLRDEDGCEPHAMALSGLQGLGAPAQLVLGSPQPKQSPTPT